MKLFLRWEIDLNFNYLKNNPGKYITPDIAVALQYSKNAKLDITIDEIRQLIGTPSLHPDGNPYFGSSPNRGGYYVWQEPEVRAGDSVIPAVIKQTYNIPTYKSYNIGGTITASDVVSVTVTDPKLGQQVANYTVQANDTLPLVAKGVKDKINEISGLEAAKIWAMVLGTSVMISHNEVTTFSATGGSTVTIT